MKTITAAVAILLVQSACSAKSAGDVASDVLAKGPATKTDSIDSNAIAPQLKALVETTVPGMNIREAERKQREGRIYWDIEGNRPDGSEVEVDVLDADGTLTVVELQRDIRVAELPQNVVQAANAPFVPLRVIESQQIEDGSILYELFAPGREDEPALEIRLKDGKAERLSERSAH